MQQQPARRRHQRIAARLPVRISTLEPERDPWTGRPFFRACHETCENISRGGAFVHTREPIRPGRRILVELTLPDGRALEAIARVAWTRRVIGPSADEGENGIGIEFIAGASDELDALGEYLASRAES